MIAGTLVGHYRILRTLGAGGMGEVYAAEDQKLNREVALKILPRGAMDLDRRERFEREARAVAALNHPNIVTIHSVEEAADGTVFLTMELVSGQTLAEILPAHGLPLERLLAIAIPLADAVSAAHQRGITHRDLKPANVMLTTDGRVKVLDFGLAKLHEHELPAAAAATVMPSRELTGEGRIVGTVSYMSPEQAEGKPVDPRSDIFSLGIILYEMATGRRPFNGDTSVSILSAILKDVPPSVTDLKQSLPRDLARIVKRSLVKDPEHRYQTAKDLRNELEALKEDVASGEIEKPAAIAASSRPATSTTRWLAAALAASLAIAAAAVWFAVTARRQSAAPAASAADTIKLTRLTFTGKAGRAAISPDGRYVVHVVIDGGQQSLWIRQVATSSNVQIVTPAAVRYDGLTFSRDGTYIYYSTYPATVSYATLFQIPALGGTPRRLIDDVDSSVAFAPDGRQIAFIRGVQSKGENLLMIADVDGGHERRLAASERPDQFALLNPAWSPDGKTIAVVSGDPSGAARSFHVVLVDATSGTIRPLGTRHWDIPGSVAWVADGRALILTTGDNGLQASQIWQISYPTGEARRLTNDLSSYSEVSLSADGRSLVAVQAEELSHLFVGPSDDMSRGRQITSGSNRQDGTFGSLDWTPDGRLVYASNPSGNLDVFIINADGSDERQLTNEPSADFFPSVSPDGRYVVMSSNRGGTTSIWRIDIDGGHPTQLTRGNNDRAPIITPDGKTVVYTDADILPFTLKQVPLDGGESTQLFTGGSAPPATFWAAAISPDGQQLAGFYNDDSQRGWRVGIIPMKGGPLKRTPIAWPSVHWTRDGRNLTYVDLAAGGGREVWNQPSNGGPPQRIVANGGDLVIAVAWSRDGKQLAIARGTRTSDVVLMTGLSAK